MLAIIIVVVKNNNLEKFTCVFSKNKYHKFVLDTYTRGEIDRLMTFIVGKLNTDMNMSYKVLEYEKISKRVYSDLSKRYKILLLLYETKKFVAKRVIIDFINLEDKGNIKLLSVILGGSFEHIMSHPKSSRNILSRDCVKMRVPGNINIPLEYSILTPEEKQEYTSKCSLTQWILPKELNCLVEESVDEFPCRKQGKWWNKDSINDFDSETEKCKGLNGATIKRPLVPSFNPTLLGRGEDKDSSSWLFGYNMDRQLRYF